jgi:ribosomal protein S8
MGKLNEHSSSNKKLCEQVLDLLWNEGHIFGYQLSFKNSPKIKIFLKYSKGKPLF